MRRRTDAAMGAAWSRLRWLTLVALGVAGGALPPHQAGAQPATTPPPAAQAAATLATPPKAREIRLAENVFLVPDPYAKSVTGWLLVRAGCADEPKTCNGLAHYLEHLLFINRDADHRSKVALFPAGNGNGWTSHTATGYLQTFPVQAQTKAQSIDKLVAYLAGLLKDVRAEPAQADRERNIVLQEHLQRSGTPQARFAQKRTTRLLPDDPLGRSVGGDPTTIAAFDVPSATAFHQAWYSPSNVSFVFTGPLTEADLAAAIDAHIKPLAARPVATRAWLNAGAVKASRDAFSETDKDVTRPVVTYDKIVSYKEPATEREQLLLNAARVVVSTYLSSRVAGSPQHQLIDQRERIASGGFGVQRIRPGWLRLSFQGSPIDGVSADQLAEDVRKVLAGLKPDAITPAYLARFKRRVAIGRELLEEEPSRYANALVSWLQSTYSYEAWRDSDNIDRSVELRHVREIMRILARPGRELVGQLLPGTAKEARKP